MKLKTDEKILNGMVGFLWSIVIVLIIIVVLGMTSILFSQQPQSETERLRADLNRSKMLIGEYMIHINKLEQDNMELRTQARRLVDIINQIAEVKSLNELDKILTENNIRRNDG
jgi:hypothetical protein